MEIGVNQDQAVQNGCPWMRIVLEDRTANYFADLFLQKHAELQMLSKYCYALCNTTKYLTKKKHSKL